MNPALTLPQTRTATQWIFTGASSHPNARLAGIEAASAAIAGKDPKLLIVFSSADYDQAALLGGVAVIANKVPVIGCTTAGEITASGPRTTSVVIMALGGKGFSIATAAANGEEGRLRQASAEVANSFSQIEDRPFNVLLLLSDGLGGDQQEVVRGAFSVLGAEIPLVGGCAGDDMRMQHTFQFHGGEVLEHAVVGAAIGSEGPIGIGVQHGWRAVGEPMVVTASDGNQVMSLDDQPALDAYLQRLDAPSEVCDDEVAFTHFAATHPLGLSRRAGDEVRFVAGSDFATRSLNCIAAVPQGSMLRIMEGDYDSVLDATDIACEQAVAALGGRTPLGMLTFDCVARKGVLGEAGSGAEVDRLTDYAPGAPVAGFYTYGEIARTHGVSGFHNQTLVVVAFS
jgi:hypothetical protein